MSTIDENQTVNRSSYSRLSQLYRALHNLDYREYITNVIEGILKHGDDVNIAVPADSLVEFHNPDWLGFTPIHFAVLASNESGLEQLLNRGADFTVKSQNGFTALRLAIERSKNRRMRCVELEGRLQHPIADLLLLAHVGTTNITNPCCKNGISHLHIACMMNNKEAVELFLKGGVCVNQPVSMDSSELSGYTPLHFAARYCSLKVAKILLNYNVDISLKDLAGLTPLHLLIERNIEIINIINIGKMKLYTRFQEELNINDDMINLLLETHKATNSEYTVIDDFGLTHLHVAGTKRSDISVAKRLLECPTNINSPINFDSPVWPGYTPLHFAAHFNIELAKLLLENGANIAAKDANGVTPFDICVTRYEPKDIVSILSIQNLKNILMSDNTKLLDIIDTLHDLTLLKKYLTKNGHQKFVTLDSPIWTGYTPLHITVAFVKNIKSVYELQAKCDYPYEFETYDNQSRLIKQIQTSTAMVLRCIKHGADVTFQNTNGMTPLDLAFRQQKVCIINELIVAKNRKNFKVNTISLENVSDFHMACAVGHVESIKAMLRANVDVNSPVKSDFKWNKNASSTTADSIRAGSTALHISVIFKHLEIVELLLKHGANSLERDDNGLTPVHIAFAFHLSRYNDSMLHLVNALLTAPGIESANPLTSEGLSHFHVACFVDNRSLAEKLLQLGLANVNDPITRRTIDTNADISNAVEATDYSGYFLPVSCFVNSGPLHFSVKGRALETLELLLINGADVCAKNAAGLTPLQLILSIYNRDEQKDRAMVDRLAAVTPIGSNYVYEANNGLTPFHLACFTLNKEDAKKALDLGVDVNACLDLDSPIWPGSTSLYLLIRKSVNTWETYRFNPEDIVKIKDIAEMLLEHNVDVNLKSANNVTTIHTASELIADGNSRGEIIDLLLRNRRTFEANPVNNEGLSHFHVACMGCDSRAIEEFLSRGIASIERPKDYYVDEDGGYTPLHFAMAYGSRATVEKLLHHGASVDNVDCNGLTPLHVAAQREGCLDNVETILSLGKADVNARNIFGETPLELCLNGEFECSRTKNKMIEVLLRHGARVNVVNPMSSESLLAIALRLGDNKNAFNVVMENASDLTDVDPVTGFNAIHNIVSNHAWPLDLLVDAIEQLLEKNCDLDHRDSKGRTALHLAVQFDPASDETVRALLENGANINIPDENGMVPLDYLLEPSQQLAEHDRVTKALLIHVLKLTFVEFDVSGRNKSHFSTVNLDTTTHEAAYSLEFERMKKIEIDEGYSLRDFITVEGLPNYPRMSQQRRHVIDRIVGSRDLRAKFPELCCLMKLQYRMALMRI